MYIDAKAALDRKDRDGAIAAFRGNAARWPTIRTSRTRASISELRLLGAGFLDLSRALPAAAAGVRRPRRPVPQPPRLQRPAVVVPPVAAPRGACLRGCRPMPRAASPSTAARSACESTRTGKSRAAEMLVPVHPIVRPAAPAGGSRLELSTGSDEWRRRCPPRRSSRSCSNRDDVVFRDVRRNPTRALHRATSSYVYSSR